MASGALYIEANVTGLDATTVTAASLLNMTLAGGVRGGGERAGGLLLRRRQRLLRGPGRGARGCSTRTPFFTDKMSVADVWDASAGTWRLQAVVDRSLLEVFLDGGVHAGTVLLFPARPLVLLRLQSADMPPWHGGERCSMGAEERLGAVCRRDGDRLWECHN